MNKVFIGDCRDIMIDLIIQGVKVQMCVTSPPYWGLRDYGTAKWEGGDPNCPHVRQSKKSDKTITGHKNFDEMLGVGDAIQKEICNYCGAIRIDQQLGLEPTPEAYVENMVGVFRLVRELLSDDGTLWLILGDTYAGSGCGTNDYRTEASRSINKSDVMFSKNPPQQRLGRHGSGFKPKDLVGIPWRVAFALQADGWYLRQDIIWHKPNPMPESVKDRCTKSHEYVFLMAKSPKYYYDAEAIKERSTDSYEGRRGKLKHRNKTQSAMTDRVFNIPYSSELLRNKRSVWTVPIRSYKGAHFAVFPPALIEPCILAGSRVGDIVLDPFFGSGTTGGVAEKLGRKWIGIELNKNYEKLWKERINRIKGDTL